MGKKKANGEGSITKRSDGRYMGRYTVNGKRKSVYGATHSEVRKKLNEILNNISKGCYIEPRKETFGCWLQELGETMLTALNREQIQRLFNKKSAETLINKGFSAQNFGCGGRT